jgi:phage-Barnase-EndoU-ColicinE5/D-RelE like nuclease3
VAPDGQISADGAARQHADATHRIRRFLRLAAKDRVETLVLGRVPHAPLLRKTTGIDPTGFTLLLESNHARHALIRHGDPRNEARRGQLALDPADLGLLAAVLHAPDLVQRGEISRRGVPTAVFMRRIGKAEYVVVAELRVASGILAFKTMLKRPIRGTRK